MKQRRWLWLTAVVLSLSLIELGGCKQLTQVGIGTQPIDQVLKGADRRVEPVTVRGKVITHLSILKQSAYLLQDGTGFLWVMTQQPLPTVDSTITVRGNTQAGETFASVNEKVILAEIERL